MSGRSGEKRNKDGGIRHPVGQGQCTRRNSVDAPTRHGDCSGAQQLLALRFGLRLQPLLELPGARRSDGDTLLRLFAGLAKWTDSFDCG